jgi:hypothetical protein
MKMRTLRSMLLTAFLAAGLLLGAGYISAHHAETDYDLNTVYVMSGTVTRFDFVNPHIVVRYIVARSDGQQEEWVAHGGAPNHERRSGWTANTIKTGDAVKVTGFRQVEGRHLIQMAVIEVNGKVYERRAGSAFRRYTEYLEKHPDKPVQQYN